MYLKCFESRDLGGIKTVPAASEHARAPISRIGTTASQRFDVTAYDACSVPALSNHAAKFCLLPIVSPTRIVLPKLVPKSRQVVWINNRSEVTHRGRSGQEEFVRRLPSRAQGGSDHRGFGWQGATRAGPSAGGDSIPELGSDESVIPMLLRFHALSMRLGMAPVRRPNDVWISDFRETWLGGTSKFWGWRK